MRTIVLASLLVIAASANAQEANSQGEAGIAPPANLDLPSPAPQPETLPAPNQPGERLQLGRDLDLGQLRQQFGPEGRRFLHRNGDRGISFGLDMAQRGINFGLRYANGHAGPADARAFGIDMGRRGKAFGLEMRDRTLDAIDDVDLPIDGRDAKFQETPGEITIDAPPLGVAAPRSLPEAKVYGRDVLKRDVKFRREF